MTAIIRYFDAEPHHVSTWSSVQTLSTTTHRQCVLYFELCARREIPGSTSPSRRIFNDTVLQSEHCRYVNIFRMLPEPFNTVMLMEVCGHWQRSHITVYSISNLPYVPPPYILESYRWVALLTALTGFGGLVYFGLWWQPIPPCDSWDLPENRSNLILNLMPVSPPA